MELPWHGAALAWSCSDSHRHPYATAQTGVTYWAYHFTEKYISFYLVIFFFLSGINHPSYIQHTGKEAHMDRRGERPTGWSYYHKQRNVFEWLS